MNESKVVEIYNFLRGDTGVPYEDLHPGMLAILQFFEYGHLPEHLQVASKRFCELACHIALGKPNAERTVALRKLLESKDAAVRADL